MKDTLISSVDCQLFNIPLAEILTDAKHGAHTHFQLITTSIVLNDGSSGTGYTYTGGRGGHAIKAMIDHDIAPFLIGKDGTMLEEIYEALEWQMHYVGRGGIVSFATSTIDIALWDIRGKSQGLPLWKMAGGADKSCKAYCGGIDLLFSLEKLLVNIQGYLDKGFNAVL